MRKQFPRVAIGASVAVLAGAANAEVPAGVLTAITTAGTDAVTVAAAVFVVLVGIFAVKLMRRGM